jgi:hypothetical protein
VERIHLRWLREIPLKYKQTSTEYETVMFNSSTSMNPFIYRLLKGTVTHEMELFELLDKLGKHFTTRERWNLRQHRRMVVRSMNRWFNDQTANKSLQLLAIVCSHEFTNTGRTVLDEISRK